MKYFLPLLTIMSLLFQPTSSRSPECAKVIDIMFLLDGTLSIVDKDLDLLLIFVNIMISDHFYVSQEANNIGVTMFSTDINYHIDLAPFRDETYLTLSVIAMNTKRGVKTNTAKGIAKVHQIFQKSLRSNAQKFMILITDGTSENSTETIKQAKMAKADGIHIIAVGVGGNVSLEEARKIVTNPSDFYKVPDFAALDGIGSDIRNRVCGASVNTTTQSSSVPTTTPVNNL